MMDDQVKDSLISYRLAQSNETINEVSKLIESGLFNIAVNRVYYGMFYCLLALALKYDFRSSKHLQLIGWFNKTFIKTGMLEISFGQILREAYKNRTEGDYVPYITFSEREVLLMLDNLKTFISGVSELLREK
jgi:uncharacterized protein (UPF0332 family)